MSTFTETVSVADLEEMLANDIPCGGNVVPKKRPCPHSAAAVLVSSHRCSDIDDSKNFKCFACYEVWVVYAMQFFKGVVYCPACGWRGNAHGLYRPL